MPHPYVDFDNEAFARQAVARLVEQGARPAQHDPAGRQVHLLPAPALRGFVSAAREAGVAHEVLEGVTLDSDREEISGALNACLRRPERPNGFVCVGEVTALMTMAGNDRRGAYPRDRGRYLRQARLADLRQYPAAHRKRSTRTCAPRAAPWPRCFCAGSTASQPRACTSCSNRGAAARLTPRPKPSACRRCASARSWPRRNSSKP